MRIKGSRGITINTDASYNHQKRVGGYAFYIVCSLFKIQKSGMFKGNPGNAMRAELMCMANALHTLAAQRELPEFDWIVINSDALHSFQYVKKSSSSDVGRVVAKKLRSVREKTGFPDYELRHVKAHNGTPDARSWVNDWCDKEAKKWMRLAASKVN